MPLGPQRRPGRACGRRLRATLHGRGYRHRCTPRGVGPDALPVVDDLVDRAPQGVRAGEPGTAGGDPDPDLASVRAPQVALPVAGPAADLAPAHQRLERQALPLGAGGDEDVTRPSAHELLVVPAEEGPHPSRGGQDPVVAAHQHDRQRAVGHLLRLDVQDPLVQAPQRLPGRLGPLARPGPYVARASLRGPDRLGCGAVSALVRPLGWVLGCCGVVHPSSVRACGVSHQAPHTMITPVQRDLHAGLTPVSHPPSRRPVEAGAAPLRPGRDRGTAGACRASRPRRRGPCRPRRPPGSRRPSRGHRPWWCPARCSAAR